MFSFIQNKLTRTRTNNKRTIEQQKNKNIRGIKKELYIFHKQLESNGHKNISTTNARKILVCY